MQFQHGTNLGSQQGIDPLGTLSGTGSNNPSGTIKALKNYQAIVVQTRAATSGIVRMYCASVGDASVSGFATTGLTGYFNTAVALDYNYLVTATRWEGYQAIIPCVVNAGDAVNVQAFCNGVQAGSNVLVYGLNYNPGVRMRSDGRAYPLGGFAQQISTGSGSPVLAALNVPFRYFIKSAVANMAIVGGSGTVAYQIGGLIGGNGSPILGSACQASATGAAGGGVQGASIVFEEGLLMDVGAAITFTKQTLGSAPTQDGTLIALYYDIIV